MAKIKTGPKVLAAMIVIGGGVYGANWYVKSHGAAKMQSSVPQTSGQLSDFKEAEATPQATPAAEDLAGAPSDKPARTDTPRVKMLVIPWNSQMGLMLANGGPVTTEGSLMLKHGVNLEIERQDDYGKMQESLVACATELSKGKKRCTTGANFVTIMGDAGPAFFAGLNAALGKLGPDYKAEVVGSSGRSYGEDKFMAPENVKSDPKHGRGLVVSGVLKDGDWNIALFWARENEICNNPDVTTFDPDCLNWVGTSSFVEADDKYIQGYCEDRPVVRNGRKTGETKNVCVNAVVTWTPGDVAVAKKKGGLVSVLSTRENGSQMPQVFVGIKKWNSENRDTVKGMLKAVFEAGDKIKTGGQAVLKQAAVASHKVYKEETPAWWMKYYRGVEEEDAQGNLVQLGGSRVFNLADNLRYYGLEPGTENAYAATYVTFGEIAKQQYPADLPTYPAVSEVLNTSFVQEIAAEGLVAKGTADAPSFEDASGGELLAKRSWKITFETGKASFTKDANATLGKLLQELVVASDTVVEIHGHTDSVGTVEGNQKLSESRANAVKTWLEQQARGNFPEGRVRSYAHGQSQPVATNNTESGKAANRRVEIVLKSNN